MRSYLAILMEFKQDDGAKYNAVMANVEETTDIMAVIERYNPCHMHIYSDKFKARKVVDEWNNAHIANGSHIYCG